MMSEAQRNGLPVDVESKLHQLEIMVAEATAVPLSAKRDQRAPGTSPSSSVPRPPSASHPRASAREQTSARRLDLPIPGSPTTASAPPAPAASPSSAASSAASSLSRPTSGARPFTADHGAPGCLDRQTSANEGVSPMFGPVALRTVLEQCPPSC
jgi:hypothetical protein